MTAISGTIGTRRGRVSRNVTHSLWRDTGIGLAIAMIALTMMVAGTHGKSGIHADGSWPGFEVPRQDGQIAPRPDPDLFPRHAPSDYTAL